MSASLREQTPELEIYLFNRISSDFNGFGTLFCADLTGLAVCLEVASEVKGFAFLGPCALLAIAGFGLFELGLELLGLEPFRLVLPSFLFINS
jgi:hypothetical protein